MQFFQILIRTLEQHKHEVPIKSWKNQICIFQKISAQFSSPILKLNLTKSAFFDNHHVFPLSPSSKDLVELKKSLTDAEFNTKKMWNIHMF
jgi:hypothetical protein